MGLNNADGWNTGQNKTSSQMFTKKLVGNKKQIKFDVTDLKTLPKSTEAVKEACGPTPH